MDHQLDAAHWVDYRAAARLAWLCRQERIPGGAGKRQCGTLRKILEEFYWHGFNKSL